MGASVTVAGVNEAGGTPHPLYKEEGSSICVTAASGGHENHCFDHVGDFVFGEVSANVSDEM